MISLHLQSMRCVVLVSFLVSGLAAPLFGLGRETKGNQSLGDKDYEEWEGVMPIVNHRSRVYHRWVNGNESFWYRGDNDALNDFLKAYAGSSAGKHEAHLQAGSSDAEDWDGNSVSANWRLRLATGLYLSHLRSEGKEIRPTVTIFVDGVQIVRDEIELPPSVIVVEAKPTGTDEEKHEPPSARPELPGRESAVVDPEEKGVSPAEAAPPHRKLTGYGAAVLLACIVVLLAVVLFRTMWRGRRRKDT